MSMEILIATNGHEQTWQGIEYGAWLAESMQMKIVLLGVNENSTAKKDNHYLDEILERAGSLFKTKDLEFRLEVRVGDAEKAIPEKANDGEFITVVGPLGRSRIKRWLAGRSIRPLLEKITGPIIYVPQMRLPLKKILISIGGLGYADSAEELAFRIAAANQADVAILHVIPPTGLDYPTTRVVSSHIDNLIETDTPQGHNLKKGLEKAHNYGLNANALVRQGNILDEILDEVKTGDYDLVCLGSSYSTHTLRQFYTPNMTAEVSEVLNCPVLTVRHEWP